MSPSAPESLGRLSFLLPAPTPGMDSRTALHDALQLIALGESLGYAGAWVPWKGPDDAVWSAIALLAAATQHTQRIELGAHAVPAADIGRHDLPAADLLSRGRFQLGLDDTDDSPTPAYPGSEALTARIWAEARDADEAGRAAADRRHLFTGSRIHSGGDADITGAQADLVRTYLDRSRPGTPGRIAVGRVVLPLDSAERANRELLLGLGAPPADGSQVPALVGPSDELVAQLSADPALPWACELRLELPPDVGAAVCAQILHDVAEYVAPELGWQAPSRPSADVTALYI